MLYKYCKKLIESGRIGGMAEKLGLLLMGGSLTEEQYAELAEMVAAKEAGA